MAALKRMGLYAIDKLTAEFVRVCTLEMPREDGHGHEALHAAATQVGLLSTVKAGEAASDKASGDVKAHAAGVGSFKENKAHYTAKIKLNLPFLADVEHGLPQVPIGPGGTKKAGHKTLRELYAERNSMGGGKGQSGPGFVRWEEGGVRYYARSHVSKGSGFFAKAIQAVNNLAQRMNLGSN